MGSSGRTPGAVGRRLRGGSGSLFFPSIPRLSESRRRSAASFPILNLLLKLGVRQVEGFSRDGVPSLMLASTDVTTVLQSVYPI